MPKIKNTKLIAFPWVIKKKLSFGPETTPKLKPGHHLHHQLLEI